MKPVDLHTHSTFSDGTLTPVELVNEAVKTGLKAIALTDHDTIEGVEEASKAGAKNNLEIISGTEISSDYNGKEIHIIGLFVNNKSAELSDFLNHLKQMRDKRNLKMIDKLNQLGIKITLDELEKISSGKIITRAHFARLIVEKGYSNSVNECFNKYLGDGKPGYINRVLPSYTETIAAIKKADGIAVLAHPLLYGLSENEINIMLSNLKTAGLTAMECYYSTHSKTDEIHLLNLCRKYDILPSGGSDFHGMNKPDIKMGIGKGNLCVPYSVLEKLKEVK